jgi:hypothetical protein
MTTLHSYTTLPDKSRTITWSTTTSTKSLPAPLRRISPSIYNQLINAPNLTTITFPSLLSNEINPPHTFWGSQECFEAQKQVILIRTYVHEDTEEVFMHVRSYSAMCSHIEDGLIYRSENVWEEFLGYWDGKELRDVSGEMLGSVYGFVRDEEDRGKVGWTRPGRGLRLDERGWEILRRLR